MSALPQTHLLKSGQTVTIREAQPADAEAVLAYIHQIAGETAFLTMIPGELQMTPEQEAAYFQECIDTENKVFLLAVVDETVVGACSFGAGARIRTRHAGEFGMSVKKSHWGQGIGRLLVATLLVWAKSTGVVRKVNLRVRTDNTRAIALYESCGFLLEGTLREELRVGDEIHDLHCMGLILPHDAPAVDRAV
jgi:RimJ/RimL family protein N-acetyltransferase